MNISLIIKIVNLDIIFWNHLLTTETLILEKTTETLALEKTHK